jgi:hypothetical protein
VGARTERNTAALPALRVGEPRFAGRHSAIPLGGLSDHGVVSPALQRRPRPPSPIGRWGPASRAGRECAARDDPAPHALADVGQPGSGLNRRCGLARSFTGPARRTRTVARRRAKPPRCDSCTAGRRTGPLRLPAIVAGDDAGSVRTAGSARRHGAAPARQPPPAWHHGDGRRRQPLFDPPVCRRWWCATSSCPAAGVAWLGDSALPTPTFPSSSSPGMVIF